MAFNQTEKQEREYLQRIITLLKKIINGTDRSVKEHVDTLAEYKDYLWSNKDIDPQEIRSMRESILNHFALGESVIDKRKRLTKILAIPYFGRIDFHQKKEGDKVIPAYIGIHTFYDSESKTTLIYDWRAPISSMFYDHELGEETVPEASMEQILCEVLDHKYKYLNFFQQVNELLTKPALGFIDRIQYKSSFDFISSLDQFVLYIENHYFQAKDVKLTKHITIPAGFIAEQFRRFNRYPMRQRFESMADYILDMMKVQYAFTATTAERNFLKKEIKQMFVGNNDLQVYKDFFVWVGKPELFKMRKNRTLEYADLAPLASR